MVKLFLKVKHWKLFLLMFAIPMVLQMGFAIYFFTNIMSQAMAGKEPDPFVIVGLIKWIPPIIIMYLFFHYGWIWCIATGLQQKIPKGVAMKVGRFKTFLIIPVVYIALILILMTFFLGNLHPNMIESGMMPNPMLLPIAFCIFIPIHFFSIFCIFHSMYFAAKTFKTVELQREVHFSDFAPEFFLIWFYMVGVWVLQPKINKMVEEMEKQS